MMPRAGMAAELSGSGSGSMREQSSETLEEGCTTCWPDTYVRCVCAVQCYGHEYIALPPRASLGHDDDRQPFDSLTLGRQRSPSFWAGRGCGA